jgi:hypothetical protein
MMIIEGSGYLGINPRVRSAYLGIDPGANGGFVLLSSQKIVRHMIAMPSTERDIWQLIVNLGPQNPTALIEWIHPAIQGIGKSSMSKLYGNYCSLRMALTAAGIPFEDIKATKWQRELGISPRKKTENQSKWKNRLKAKAQVLFPSTIVPITLKTCDALLIAEYLRRSDEKPSLSERLRRRRRELKAR